MIRIARESDFVRTNGQMFLQEIENFYPITLEQYWGMQWFQSTFFLASKERILCIGWSALGDFLKSKNYNAASFESLDDVIGVNYSMVYIVVSHIEDINKHLIRLYKHIKPGGKIGILCKFDTSKKLHVMICENICFDLYNLASGNINDAITDFTEDMINIVGIGLYKKIRYEDGVLGEFLNYDMNMKCIEEIVKWDRNSFLGNLYNCTRRKIYVPKALTKGVFSIQDICKHYSLNIADSESLFNELYSMKLIKIQE